VEVGLTIAFRLRGHLTSSVLMAVHVFISCSHHDKAAADAKN